MKDRRNSYTVFSLAGVASIVGLTLLTLISSPVNAIEVDGEINDEEYVVNDQPVITLAPGSTGEAVQDIGSASIRCGIDRVERLIH